MAKRFLDNQLFKNTTFKGLPPKIKLFYVYLICECDHCGLWSVELDVASVRIGEQITEAEVKKYLGEKIIPIDNGSKWFLPQFVTFQYGNLTAGNKLHVSVRKELNKYNLLTLIENNQTPTEGLPNPYVSIKDKDKDKDRDKVKDKDKEKAVKIELTGWDAQDTPENTVINPLQSETVETDTEVPNESTSDYKRFMEVYHTFIKNRGIPFRITGADGKALKLIIKYLNEVDAVKQGNKTPCEVWEFILDNWNNLDTWQQTQNQLRQINAQLPNIIEKLKQYYNGKSKVNYQQNAVTNLVNALRSTIKNG
jgi:hypothetical protein